MRAIAKQYRISKSIGEAFSRRCIRLIVACAYLSKGLVIGVKSLSSEQLGSRVLYQGRKCFVSNWAGSEKPTLAADGFYQEYCNRAEIVQLRSVSEFWHRLKFGYRFYVTNWLDIDVQNRLGA